MVVDPDAEPKTSRSRPRAPTGEATSLPVWCADQAGPFQAAPHPGRPWRPVGEPDRQPHEHFRDGKAKILNLFHPADGQVRVGSVRSFLAEKSWARDVGKSPRTDE
jgi:transposase